MAVESKVIVTAEDRTKAAFAAIERNTGKTAMAMLKLQGQMLKLAGVGSLVAFFRSGAQSTEKWRDEMARLDEITEKFFKTAADSGRLDPFIKIVKLAYTTVFGASMAIENLGLAIGSLAAYLVQMAKFNAAEAHRIMELSSQDMAENEEAFRKLREELDKPAPKGFAEQKTKEDEKKKNRQKDEADRLKELVRLKAEDAQAEEQQREHLKRQIDIMNDSFMTEQERLIQQYETRQMMLDDAFVREIISADDHTRLREDLDLQHQAAMTKAEDEKAAAAEEKQRERLQRQIDIMNDSFMTEQERLIQQYETRQMMLDDAFMRDMISAEDHTRLREELELQHQAAMGDIVAQGVLARRKFEEMTDKQKIQSILGTSVQMLNTVANSNKTMFQLNKAFALANAAVNLPDAVIKSFNNGGGWPWGLIPAGIMLATGLAQINQIKSAQFGTSTSPPSIGGGGATPVFNAGGDIPDLSGPAPAPARQLNIFMSGSGRYSSDEVRSLIEQINEEQGDGSHITVYAA